MESTRDLLINNNVNRNLPFKLKIGYGFGHVLNDVCSSIWFTYLLVFLRLVLEFDNWEAGLLLLIGQITDAVANPFIGYHSDKSDGCLRRYGRRKTWHLIGTICVVVAFPFIFSQCIGCTSSQKWVKMLYYSVFIIIFQFGWAAVQISHLSLIPELSQNENDSTSLTTIRYRFTVFSNILVYVITWIVLGIGEDNEEARVVDPSDVAEFKIVVWIGLASGMACAIFFHILVKEVNYVTHYKGISSQLSRSCSEIFRNVHYYQVAIIYMCTMIFLNCGQVFYPLYLHETLNMHASSLAIIPLIAYIASFSMSLGTERLNKNFGRMTAYLIGAALGIFSCLWIYFRSDSSYIAYEVNVIIIFYGLASSIVLVTSLGITADLIGDKTESGAFVFGIMCFTDKLANGIVVFVIQHLHKSYPDKMYYRDVITYCCGTAIVLSSLVVISLKTVRRRNRQYVQVF